MGRTLVAARSTVSLPLVWRLAKACMGLSTRVAAARLGLVRFTPAELGAALAEAFEGLGPLFIKMGQLLSSRPDVTGPEVAMALRRLRYRLAPIPTAQIVSALEQSLGATVDALFLEFGDAPIATGSIAQVHRAVLRDGRVVAVKVRRPGLAERLVADFRLLRRAAWVFARIPGLTVVPWTELLDEFEAAIAAQADLRREAENNRVFAKNLPSARVPELIPALCTRDVLMMEFLPELVPLEELRLSPSLRGAAARGGLRMLYQMIFQDGFVHADLHGGNVYFGPDGALTLVDFGLVARLDPEARERFQRFFFALATGDAPLCADLIRASAVHVPASLDRAGYEQAVTALVQRFSGRAVGDFEVSRFAAALFDLQRRFRIRGSTEFTLTILSLLAFEGVVKVLDPQLPFQREAVDFLLKLPARPLDRAARAALFADIERLVESGHTPSS